MKLARKRGGKTFPSSHHYTQLETSTASTTEITASSSAKVATSATSAIIATSEVSAGSPTKATLIAAVIIAAAKVSAGSPAETALIITKIALVAALIALTGLLAQFVADQATSRRAQATSGPGIHALILIVAAWIVGAIVWWIAALVGGLVKLIVVRIIVGPSAEEAAAATSASAAQHAEQEDCRDYDQANATQPASPAKAASVHARNRKGTTARCTLQRLKRGNRRAGVVFVVAETIGEGVARIGVLIIRERHATPTYNCQMPVHSINRDHNLVAAIDTPFSHLIKARCGA